VILPTLGERVIFFDNQELISVQKISKKDLTSFFNEIRHRSDSALAVRTAVSGKLSRDSYKATPAKRNKQQTTKQK
jgi:hypothetical protein